jgi:serine phosphatase RsbU (regulator of sigma subunit)
MTTKNLLISPTSVKAFGLLAFAILVTIAGITFYNMASIPTDENIFMSTPSRVMARHELPGRFQGSPKPRGAVMLTPDIGANGITAGDLLISVGATSIRTLRDFTKAAGELREDSTLVRLFRPRGGVYLDFVVRTDALRGSSPQELDPSVFIVSILPGGASDRAGMQVGDVFSRINGAGFTDSQKADVALRRGRSGSMVLYEGFRDARPLSLPVMLARFGFPLAQLIFSLVGVAYMVFGIFLISRRPDVVAARTIGVGFLLIGFVLSVLLIRREPDPTAFVVCREILMVIGLFVGTASMIHSSVVFPVDRSTPHHRRWILPGVYGLGFLAPLLLIARNEPIIWLLYTVYLIAAGIVTFVNNAKIQPEQKRMLRSIRISVIVISVAVLGLTVLAALAGIGGVAGVVGILLLGIPLSYLYVILRYRLIDIDVRIRRNVQYTALSWIWGIVVGILFIRLLLVFPGLSLNVPGITFTGLSVEINPAPGSTEDQIFLERLVMLVLGAASWFGLWYLRKWGQRFIDKKYYRTQFDYRRAAASLADVLSSRLSMNDIARGIVETLVDLLKIRGAGLLVFRDGTECCCEAVAGVPRESWEQIACQAGGDFAAAISALTDPVRVELLPAHVGAALVVHGFRCVVPIRSHDHLVGALLVGEKLAETSLNEEDLAFLSGVAKQSAVSIDNAFLYEEHAEKERMRHELNIARRIQLGSLPSVTPDVPGLDIAGLSVPALEVGGDFYDYLGWNGKEVMVVVGDVSGKGTSAALYMAKVQGILRSLYGFQLEPREGFIRANKLLCNDLEKTSFVTALGARYVAGEKRLTLVRAGHLPLYHFHAASAVVTSVLTRGLGLGLNDAGIFSHELEDRTVQFETGDVMLFVTDGLTEARNAAGEEYGDERVMKVLQIHARRNATGIRDELLEDVRQFGAGMDQHDDQTVVVVRAV